MGNDDTRGKYLLTASTPNEWSSRNSNGWEVCPPYEIITSRSAGSESLIHAPHTLYPVPAYVTPSPTAHGAYCAAEHLSTTSPQCVTAQSAKVYLYQAPTPLHELGPLDTLIDCPYCGTRARTKTSPSSGNMNQWVIFFRHSLRILYPIVPLSSLQHLLTSFMIVHGRGAYSLPRLYLRACRTW